MVENKKYILEPLFDKPRDHIGKKTMRIGIVGSRSIAEEAWIWEQIDKFIQSQCAGCSPCIVTGDAAGVDYFVERYARHNALNCIVLEPTFKVDRTLKYHPAMYFTRNMMIVHNSDKMLALWDGESRGTDNTVQYAKQKKVPIMVITK